MMSCLKFFLGINKAYTRFGNKINIFFGVMLSPFKAAILHWQLTISVSGWPKALPEKPPRPFQSAELVG